MTASKLLILYDIISDPIEIARLIKGLFNYMHIHSYSENVSQSSSFLNNGILFQIAKLIYIIYD